MLGDSLDADLDLAHRLADAASAVTLDRFRGELKRERKADGSLVTDADLAAEDELRRLLGVERPDDAILGEERGQTGTGGRRWILDAIDGTVDFADGGPDWGTLIALEVDHRIVVGVFDQPVYERRYWATRAGGAFCEHRTSGERKRLAVTTTSELSAARSFVPAPKHQRDQRKREIAKALAAATIVEPRREHPAMQVASGGYELALFLSGGPWDFAALAVIVEEAGGKFTDSSGVYNLFSNSAVFSNGVLHAAALRLIATASAEPSSDYSATRTEPT